MNQYISISKRFSTIDYKSFYNIKLILYSINLIRMKCIIFINFILLIFYTEKIKHKNKIIN